MPKPRASVACIAILTVLVLTGIASADTIKPSRFQDQLDADLVGVVHPSGTQFVAWSYGQNGETDIAIARLDGKGRWSDPTLLGAGDGVDQVAPALVADLNGHIYLVWAENPSGRIQMSVLVNGSDRWSAPISLRKGGAANPTLLITSSQNLVVGYQTDRGTELRQLFLLPQEVLPSISDGPDPVGYSTDPPDSNPGNEENDRDDRGFDTDDVISEILANGTVQQRDQRGR